MYVQTKLINEHLLEGSIILTVKEINEAATKLLNYEINNKINANHFAHAAKTMRLYMFEKCKPFVGFTKSCQKESVP